MIRTRIAPSPTGDPHVGTAYIALFNMMFAHSHKGQFILRIEDTDQQRSSEESEKAIFDSLRWLNLHWDEGPDIGGNYGPYRQSERSAIYTQHVQQLINAGHAFHCFCSAERLETLRASQAANKQTSKYDGHCLHLSAEEVQTRLDNKENHVIRMKVPAEGTCEFNDMLRGTIAIDWEHVDMQVLLKTDGMPTYHLANVIDDHLMQISHVIRGEEWINSAPKHKLLYDYFGWKMPELCHMPLLRNPDTSKLSKRKNPTSIGYYRDMGYLPEAMINFLGRMGWSMPDEREKFTLDEMLQHFDIQRVSTGGPVFDQEKLTWLNGCWIRENLSDEQLYDVLNNWRLNRSFIRQFLPLAKTRMEKLSDFADLAGFMFQGMPQLTAEQFIHKKLSEEEVKKILQFIVWKLEDLTKWNKEVLFAEIKQLAQTMELKIKDVMLPVFVAIAGTPNSWSVVDSMEILGPNISLARLRHAVSVLGGFSKKGLKKLQKTFAEIA